MRALLIAGLFVATAAHAQGLIAYDGSTENGFDLFFVGANINPFMSSDCFPGNSCVNFSFEGDDAYAELTAPAGLNLFDYDGFALVGRSGGSPVGITFTLLSNGLEISDAVPTTLGANVGQAVFPFSMFNTPSLSADGLRIRGPVDGGPIILDDIVLAGPSDGGPALTFDAGSGGGDGRGGGDENGGGSATGGSFTPPATGGGFNFGGGSSGGGDSDLGGSGRFGGGADLGCNCESGSSVGLFTTFFGLAVSLQLRRRRR